jgi:hypothetical protein
VKGLDPQYAWEIMGICRALNEDMLTIERLAARTLPTRSIIGGDLNLPQVDWKGDAGKARGFQAFVDNLVWNNGYTEEVSGLTRQDVLLHIYLLKPESSLFFSRNILPGMSDHYGVLWEVEWDEICRESKMKE